MASDNFQIKNKGFCESKVTFAPKKCYIHHYLCSWGNKMFNDVKSVPFTDRICNMEKRVFLAYVPHATSKFQNAECRFQTQAQKKSKIVYF